MVPHFAWERGNGVGYELPRYETRRRIARVKADDLGPAELKRLLMTRFFESQQAGNTHLFLYCFEEFLQRTKALGKAPAEDHPPSATLRSVLLAEYLKDLAREAEELHSRAASLKRKPDGRPQTVRQMSARDARRMELLEKAASLEAEVDSAAAADSILLRFFRQRKIVSLPFDQVATYRPDVDLNERIPSPAKFVFDGYWDSVFSAITTGNPEPDDLEWDDVASDFHPKLVADVAEEGRVLLRIISDDKILCDSLYYVSGYSLPLRREEFGRATKSRDGFICPVSFPDQRKRYVQFVCIDSDGDGHRSPLYEIDPAGHVDEILPRARSRGGHAESGDPYQKDTASKTASKRVAKGTSKPKRAR